METNMMESSSFERGDSNLISSSSPEESSFIMTPFAILLSLFLGVLILTTIIGNVFVIVAILMERNLRTVANYLVFSLAVADLMVACLVMPIGAINEVTGKWIFGPKLCDAWTCMDVLSCTASILHLVAIALDRYWAVTNIDYTHSRTSKSVGKLIFGVWFVAVIVSVAPILGWKDDNYLKRIEEEKKCIISQDVAYQVLATCATFYGPLIVILILYWKIFKVARKRIRYKPGSRLTTTSPKPILVPSSRPQAQHHNPDKKSSDKLILHNKTANSVTFGTFKEQNAQDNHNVHPSPNDAFEDQENKLKNADVTLPLVTPSSLDNKRFDCLTSDQISRQDDCENTPSVITKKVTILNQGHCMDEEEEVVMEETPMMIEVHSSESSGSNTTTNVVLVNNRVPSITKFTHNDKTSKTCKMCKGHSQDVTHQANSRQNEDDDKSVSVRCEKQPDNSCEGNLSEKRMTLTTTTTTTASEMLTITSQEDEGKVEASIFVDNAETDIPPSTTSTNDKTSHKNIGKNIDNNASPTSSSSSSKQGHPEEYDAKEEESSSSQGSRVLLCFSSPHHHRKKRDPCKSSESSPLMTRMMKGVHMKMKRRKESQEERTSSPDVNHSDSLAPRSSLRSKKSISRESVAYVENNVNTSSMKVNAMVSSRESMESKRERKAAKTLVIITGAFVVCWLPFFVTALVLPVCGESCDLPDFVLSVFLWLGYINSMINPIIYTIFSMDFRTAFKKILMGKRFKMRDHHHLPDKKVMKNTGGCKRVAV